MLNLFTSITLSFALIQLIGSKIIDKKARNIWNSYENEILSAKTWGEFFNAMNNRKNNYDNFKKKYSFFGL
jgi:hypothetical protein